MTVPRYFGKIRGSVGDYIAKAIILRNGDHDMMHV